jgi:hypothetical protein
MSNRGHFNFLKGRHNFVVTDELLQMMETQSRLVVNWSFDNNNSKETNQKFRLNKDSVKVLHQRLQTSIGIVVTGFTKAVISCGGVQTHIYAHPCFHQRKWYDWALVHFEENNNQGDRIESHYPSQILGYISIDVRHEAAV